MAVDKLAISLEPGLTERIREAAEREGSSVSGWLADAALWKLKNGLAAVAYESWEAEFGSPSEAQEAAADRLWRA